MNRNSAKMVPVVQPVAQCLTSAQRFDPTVETLITSEVAETLIATDHKGPGHNRDHNFIAQPVAFHHNAQASQLPTDARDTSISDALTVSQQAAVAQPVIYQDSQFGVGEYPTAGSLRAGRIPEHQMIASCAIQVRRLTPVECERLQGFPDNYTNIPWRKKPESPDGPRYKALGNSMAVPVMAWIGNRIQHVSKL